MRLSSAHIVSSLQWSTSFDRKDKAGELQERLSAWSRYRVQSIFEKVFDQLCPEDQTWRIDSLQLDLGSIPYDELETELTLRIRKQLQEKLTDMIIYAGNGDTSQMEIIGEDVSVLSMLHSFLVYGIMPWNHSASYPSVEEMMSAQLHDNRYNAVNMLWEAGSTHAEVRKRMVLQFREPIVITIIEALEPNNASQIIEFTQEVTEIQQKERIVESSIGTFKKDLYLWVLNYLFDERGSVFNRIAFMKSAIRQMAAHHNLRYEELLGLINRATERIVQRTSIHPDFIQTLRVLSAETQESREDQEAARASAAADGQEWKELEMLLRDHTARAARLPEFNDLLVALARKDSAAFTATFQPTVRRESEWEKVSVDLTVSSAETLVHILSPSRAAIILRSVEFLAALFPENQIRIADRVLWNVALDFARRHANVSFGYAKFVQYAVARLSVQVRISETEMLLLIAAAKVPASMKTFVASEVYAGIQQLLHMTAGAEQVRVTHEWLSQLIAELVQARKHTAAGGSQVQALQKQITRIVERFPKLAAEVFTAYASKEELADVVPFLLAPAHVRSMITHLPADARSIHAAAGKALVKLRRYQPAVALAAFIEEHAAEWIWKSVVLHRKTTGAGIAEAVLRQLQLHVHRFGERAYVLFIALFPEEKIVREVTGTMSRQELITDTQLSTEELERQLALRFSASERTQFRKLFAGLSMEELIANPFISTEELGAQLLQRFTSAAFIAFRKSSAAKSLLDRFVSGGHQLMAVFVQEYSRLLTAKQTGKQATAIAHELIGLYWRCALSYSTHAGNPAQLRTVFESAIRARFATDVTSARSQRAQQEEQFTLSDGSSLTMRELFRLVEESFSGQGQDAELNGKKYVLTELLKQAAVVRPAELRRIISKTSLTPALLRVLEDSELFRETALWIMTDVQGAKHAFADAMRMLYDTVALFATGPVPQKYAQEFWKELWKLAGGQAWGKEEMKKLIRHSFTQLAHDRNIGAHHIMEEIKQRNMRITPLLYSTLAECFPAFEALAQARDLSDAGKQLLGFEKRGLLENLARHFVTDKAVPSWFGVFTEAESGELLNELIVHHPEKFIRAMKGQPVASQQMQWFSRMVKFDSLIRAISYVHPDKESLVAALSAFHRAMEKVRSPAFSAADLQFIIFKKLLGAWANNNWKVLSGEHLWNELVWELSLTHGVQRKAFFDAMEKMKTALPVAMQVTLQQLLNKEKRAQTKPAVPSPKKIIKSAGTGPLPKPAKTGIAVKNAGVVLLNTYIPMLFERLGLLSERRFRSPAQQNDAVHYLQYVITGLSHTEESFLPLNKVLCGLPLSHAVQEGIEVTDAQKQLIEGLVRAAIGYWPAIGDTSVDGFRGNWLVRDGMLTEHEEHWELAVEKRPYDVLINKSPFSFSIIRYQWMEKPLHVTWSY
jgi:hypothetical protein